MNKNGGRKILPPLISALLLLMVAIAAEVIYSLTKYLPLCLFALTCMLPAAANLIVMLSRLRFPEGRKENEISSCMVPSEGETPVEEAPSSGKRSKKNAKKKEKKPRGTGFYKFARFYNRNRAILASILMLAATVAIQIRFFLVQSRLTSLYVVNYPVLIGLVLLFTVFISLDKWCLHAKTGDSFSDSLLKNLRSVLALLRLALIFMMISVALKIFGVYDAQVILKYALMILFYYQSVFLILTFIVSLIKKELLSAPVLYVPAPLAIGSSKELSLLTYFEENTGMTMRSLWSIRLVKALLPYTVALAAILLWFTTGLVQIEPHQTGIYYRFGKMADEVLEPGLHLCLPWPCDKIEIYDTENVKRFTVGYVSDEDDDNTWTGKHGSEEYRLLLGSRDELVSVNLRIEYKISDLRLYLMNNSDPVSLIKASAYQWVLDHTITSDLDSLLAVNRSEFSQHLISDLTEEIKKYNTGISIVSVVLESIHPPIDISETYQEIISAEIEAQRLVKEAEGYYEKTITEAEQKRDTEIYNATVNQITKVANANAEVAEFMANVAADGKYPSTYRYYKYLNAITSAYGSTRLVIVGDGIDSSNIYLGSLLIGSSSVTPPSTEPVE